jgi:hypothetical protein
MSWTIMSVNILARDIMIYVYKVWSSGGSIYSGIYLRLQGLVGAC